MVFRFEVTGSGWGGGRQRDGSGVEWSCSWISFEGVSPKFSCKSASRYETRYYLSSAEPAERTDAQWQDLVRGHWGGVEIRNHWRRDALWGEDRSRTCNANALANLALLRNAAGCPPSSRKRRRPAERRRRAGPG
jgi:hypothetical protein